MEEPAEQGTLSRKNTKRGNAQMKKNFRTGKSICSKVGVLLVCTLLIGALSACNAGGKGENGADTTGKDESTVSASDSAAEAVEETEKDSDSGQADAAEAAAASAAASETAASETAAAEQAQAAETTAEQAQAEKTGAAETAAAEETSRPADPALEASIEKLLSEMTLEEKIGQMFMPAFRVWQEETDTEGKNLTVQNSEDAGQEVNVTELNDRIRECMAKYHFGGVLLFAENFRDAEQTLRLTSDLQQTNQEAGGLPLLVAADQEGGYITRLTYGTRGPGNMALAATGNPENAGTMASIYGKELSLVGVNTDYAPVMDINNNPNNPVIGVRSFGDSPDKVVEYGLPFIEGLHDQGTIVTLKHFPGHGNTDTDSHTGFPCIQSTYEELKNFELVPFQAAIDAGADMIMTAHIQYPQIETDTCTSISTGEQIYLPATMSDAILTDILRGEMGFEGVVVTDALDMAAIADNFSLEDTICMTINAGADMLIPPTVLDAEKFHKLEEMLDLAVQLAKDGKIDARRIDESVRRILTLKGKYGLLDRTDFAVTDEQVSAAVKGVGSDENRQTAWDITEQALTLVKNENEAFPVKAEAGQKVLVLFAGSCASRAGTGDFAKQILTEKGLLPEGTDYSVMVNTAENNEECIKAAVEADHVIMVHSMYDASNLDPNTEDGLSSAVFSRIIEERHAAGKKAVLISAQLPYDANRFPEADAVLLTYGSYIMREVPPASGEGSAYMPNLPAGICACFGMGEPGGTVPVTLPQIDENYRLTTNP